MGGVIIKTNFNHELFIHIILFLFTAGIGNIIYLIHKNNNQKSNKNIAINSNLTYSDEENFQKGQIIAERISSIEKQYDKFIKVHYNLLERIGYQYSVAINQSNIFNQESEKCIRLCKEDIKIASIMKEYFEKEHIVRQQTGALPSYPSFKYLAMLYEKQQNYQSAIYICIDSIKLGFLSDGTSAGMQGRLAKLIKKFNGKYNLDIKYDYEKNVIYNNDNGEIIN